MYGGSSIRSSPVPKSKETSDDSNHHGSRVDNPLFIKVYRRDFCSFLPRISTPTLTSVGVLSTKVVRVEIPRTSPKTKNRTFLTRQWRTIFCVTLYRNRCLGPMNPLPFSSYPSPHFDNIIRSTLYHPNTIHVTLTFPVCTSFSLITLHVRKPTVPLPLPRVLGVGWNLRLNEKCWVGIDSLLRNLGEWNTLKVSNKNFYSFLIEVIHPFLSLKISLICMRFIYE